MLAINVPAGKFRMSTPIRSVQGNFILVGAIVGGVGIYSRRVKPEATRDDLRRAYGLLRDQIHKEHPGIQEEFTMLRPKTSFN